MVKSTFDIVPLFVDELDLVDGGGVIAARAVFEWVGIAGAIEWAGQKAYAAGVWVGEHS